MLRLIDTNAKCGAFIHMNDEREKLLDEGRVLAREFGEVFEFGFAHQREVLGLPDGAVLCVFPEGMFMLTWLDVGIEAALDISHEYMQEAGPDKSQVVGRMVWSEWDEEFVIVCMGTREAIDPDTWGVHPFRGDDYDACVHELFYDDGLLVDAQSRVYAWDDRYSELPNEPARMRKARGK